MYTYSYACLMFVLFVVLSVSSCLVVGGHVLEPAQVTLPLPTCCIVIFSCYLSLSLYIYICTYMYMYIYICYI